MFLLTVVLMAFYEGSNHCAASPLDNAFLKESQGKFGYDLGFEVPKWRMQTAMAVVTHIVEGNVAFQFPPMKKGKTAISRTTTLPLAADDNMPDPEKTERNEPLRHAIENLVSIVDGPTSPPSAAKQSSIVHIIGTGLTPTLLNLPLSTLHILSQADVVLYDSLGLSRRDICQIVPKNCEVICVGKRGDKKSWKQKDIDELILQMATEPSSSSLDSNNQQPTLKAKSIVRLKGGDPFLFGRTRTEIEALRSHNIPYSYTPGISSCIAGPHLGGIPLTDPTLNCQSFGVWSGTDAFGRSWGLMDDGSSEGKTWRGLDVDVLVFLMIGRLDKLEALCHSIANGDGSGDISGKWNKDTPCAVIQNAGGGNGGDDSSLPLQKVWRSTIGSLVQDIKREDKTRTSVSPAVFVVGATTTLDLLSQYQQP